MTTPLRRRSALVAALLSVALAGPSLAQAQQASPIPRGTPPSGKMWPFEALPSEYLRATHGFVPDAAWLEHARLAALKIDGVGTASFVSPEGLVLTNHHCVRGFLEPLRTAERDLDRDGYAARGRDEELRLRGMRLLQLLETVDVTGRVLAGVDLLAPHAEVEARVAANRERVLAQAREEYAGFEPRLVPLYRGARFHLYVYDVWDDVRLVFSPHLDLGYFGGSTDNFSYPHFALDFALVRAYRDGEPADTSAHFYRWRAESVRAGESVFAVGNPGSTERHHTVAELRWRHEGEYRLQAAAYRDMVRILGDWLAEYPAERAANERFEFQLVTQQKYMHFAGEAWADPERRRAEERFEADLRARAAADPALAPLAARAFDALDAAAQAADRALYERAWYQSPWMSKQNWFWPLLRAVWVVEAFAPDASAADRDQARRRALQASGMAEELDERFFVAHLERAVATLGPEDPAVAAMLGGRSPAEAVRHLVATSRIGDDAFVRGLLDGDAAGVQASEDPALVAARVLYPLLLANQAAVAAVDAALAEPARLVGWLVDALHGPEVCPEPSFALRLKDGVVRGYEQLQTRLPASTNFHGLYARALEFEGHGDFELPALMYERRAALDLATPLNFVCTVDIMGGSSGSAVLDRDGLLVGLLFDGNAQMVENRFGYRDERARAIAVHAAAMLATLEDVYELSELAAELRGAGD